MEPPQTWLSEPDRLLHIAASCVVFYVYIVALTRLSGKRTTGNMNNFDWIITVGIGSLLASGILLRNVSMADAMVAVAVLAGLQWLTTWGTLRSKRFATWVKPKPRVLLDRGRLLDDEMAHERVTRDEVLAALRRAGLSSQNDAHWVILEANGQFSVISGAGHRAEQAGLLDGIAPDDLTVTGGEESRGAT